ncbi:MAG: porin family protein [Tannerellaceae bacterium]
MKRFLLVLSLVVASIGAKGQCNLSFGPKVGLNVSDLTNGDYSARVGMNVGIFAQYRFNNSWAVQPEILYSMQGAKTNGMLGGPNYTCKIDYISVPILAKFYATQGLSFGIGPQVAFRVKADAGSGTFGNNETLKDITNPVELAAAVGAAYDFPIGIVLDARYTIGVTKAFKADYWDEHNSVFQFSVGYKF